MLVRFFNALDIRAEIGESSIFAFHLSPPAFDLRFHLASAYGISGASRFHRLTTSLGLLSVRIDVGCRAFHPLEARVGSFQLVPSSSTPAALLRSQASR